MARFTQEEKKVLIDVVNSGKSLRKQAPELAKRLNRSQLSVLNKLYYLRKKLGLHFQLAMDNDYLFEL